MEGYWMKNFDEDDEPASMEVEKKKRAPRKKAEVVLTQAPPTPQYKDGLTLYKEWLDTNVTMIKEALEHAFPGRWEFKQTNSTWPSGASIDAKVDTEEEFKRRLDRHSGYFNNIRYHVIIHFPKLEVTNTEGNRVEITDVFIQIRLKENLTGADQKFFRGSRTSFTFSQWQSGYSFSHMEYNAQQLSGSGDRWSDFCLGDNTDFNSLCRSLYLAYDIDKFYLFCLQLESYLSWESMEGVPYRYIRNISTRASGSSDINVHSSDIEPIYKQFLIENKPFNINVEVLPADMRVTIKDDETLRQSLTEIVPNQFKLIWDPITKTSFSDQVQGISQLMEEAIRSDRRKISFKGTDYILKFTDAPTNGPDDRPRTVHPLLKSMFIGRLATLLNDYLKNATT